MSEISCNDNISSGVIYYFIIAKLTQLAGAPRGAPRSLLVAFLSGGVLDALAGVLVDLVEADLLALRRRWKKGDGTGQQRQP
jgi:hypothetical protein